MNLHILIIEDEPAIAENLVYACHEVGILSTHCQFGQAGIEIVKTQPVDLVVLDVGLPDMSG